MYMSNPTSIKFVEVNSSCLMNRREPTCIASLPGLIDAYMVASQPVLIDVYMVASQPGLIDAYMVASQPVLIDAYMVAASQPGLIDV